MLNKETINIFTKLKEKNVSFKSLINNIKKEYKENNSVYFSRLTDNKAISNDKNIVFSTNFSMCNISNMYLVKDIFILDNITKYDLDNNYDTSFIKGIKLCLKEYDRVRDIGDNFYKSGKNMFLNLYVNDDMEIIDFIESELINCLRDEDDD